MTAQFGTTEMRAGSTPNSAARIGVKSSVMVTMPLLRSNCRLSNSRYQAPMKPPATGIFFRSSLSTARL